MNLINLAFEGEPLNPINMDHFIGMRYPETGASLVLIMANVEYEVPQAHQHTVLEWLESQGYVVSEPQGGVDIQSDEV